MRIPQTSWMVLITFLTTVNAHSWIEQMMVIAPNGTFVGSPGYSRGNVLRTSSDFSDTKMVHMLPSSGSKVQKSDAMCMNSQKKPEQSDDSPRLQAQPGSRIALRFQENGHVTLPQNQPGKPKNRGTVYVYGTTDPKEDEKFLDIHKVWNKDGTGGDKRGVLLSKQDFDDGRCYQVNGGKISQNRQTKFPHQADKTMGADMWCQQDIALPSNAPNGKPYTLYWVWDWPTEPGKDHSLPDGKQELYTTCMDVDVTGGTKTQSRVQANYDKEQSLNLAALPDQFAEIYGAGSGSQGAASSAASSSTSPPSSLAASPRTSSSLAATQASSSASVPALYPSSSPSPSAAVTSPTMFAAHSAAAASSSRGFQHSGPSFVTLTKTVQATDCHS